ncbi:MAG: DUF3570 domain-containing protein [Polyangiales bacterium]
MRLQLSTRFAPTAIAVLLWSSSAESDETIVKASTEIAAYQDSDHIGVLSPTIAGSVESPTGGWSGHGRYLADIVSAASVDIVSTASRHWREVRHAGSFDAAYKPHEFGVSAAGSVSREPDYLALSFGGGIEQDFLQKNLTVALGYGYGHDTVGRGDTPFAVFSRTLVKHNGNLALTWIVDRITVMSLSVDGIFERGDQSKPYRYIPMFAPSVGPSLPAGASIDLVNRLRLPERTLEQLPTSRDRWALTWRFAQRRGDTTMRVTERLYYDTWGLKASTTDLRAIVDLSERVEIWPHVRMHIQSAVNFWQRAYEVDRGSASEPWTFPAFRTGDRELGALGTFTGGGGMKFGLGSAARKYSWSLSPAFDVIWTEFADALYIRNRLGVFGVLTLEAEL